MTVWDQIKQELAKRLSTESFQNWLAPTQQKGMVGSRLIVGVSSEATKVWLEQEYGEHVAAAIEAVGRGISRVEYEVSAIVTVQAGVGEGTVSTLNPKYSFSNFVVGSCNQFAHAAAKAVADNPAERYNPLFIYGGVGMGKTHLMHAIGRTLADRYGSMKIIYTSSEKFMNEMIDCIKTDRMSTFHQHYRTADILLMDDVQVLANKERTQEEFFHTFNALHENGKQIVLSSDQPPKQTQGLTDRLRSRFEWGLMVDVQPPDLETKMAILDKKAEAEGMQLPEDVRIYIATKTKSNVRELEGALVKLVAYSSVMDSPITLGMAQQVLKQLSGGGERRVTIDLIVRAVAERFSLQPGQLKLKTNVQNIAFPRQVAMYLAKEMTPSSLPEIGRYFGGKHHTTVLHSVQKIDKLRQRDGDLNRLLHSLTDSI
ncbi:MAG: chromosomal replication initiator protein DnaA [Acidobacteriota bacterium]|jgi:chromosomal replication initiator protein|nr:chromosomal replication initiator protein DnaA [Bryobacteraceae bacterium CoA2 C42]